MLGRAVAITQRSQLFFTLFGEYYTVPPAAEGDGGALAYGIARRRHHVPWEALRREVRQQLGQGGVVGSPAGLVWHARTGGKLVNSVAACC